MFVVFGQVKAIFVNKNTVNNTDCLLLAFLASDFCAWGPRTGLLQPCSNFFFTTWESGNTDIVILSGYRDGARFSTFTDKSEWAVGT